MKTIIKKIFSFIFCLFLYLCLNIAGCLFNFNLHPGRWIKNDGEKIVDIPIYIPNRAKKVNALINYFENYDAGGIAVVQMEINLSDFKSKAKHFDRIIYSTSKYLNDHFTINYYGTNKKFDYIYHAKSEIEIKIKRPSTNSYTYYTVKSWYHDNNFIRITYRQIQGNLINICWFIILGICLIGGFFICKILYYLLTKKEKID